MKLVKHKRLLAAEENAQSLYKEYMVAMAKVEKEQGNIKITCIHCDKRSAIKEWTYVQHHRYIAPFGCAGGDYWVEDYGTAVCPHCSLDNKLILDERKPYVLYKNQFKTIVNAHKSQ
jgi:DNA-directed RNA polymerase subunit RPC12/RpoP